MSNCSSIPTKEITDMIGLIEERKDLSFLPGNLTALTQDMIDIVKDKAEAFSDKQDERSYQTSIRTIEHLQKILQNDLSIVTVKKNNEGINVLRILTNHCAELALEVDALYERIMHPENTQVRRAADHPIDQDIHTLLDEIDKLKEYLPGLNQTCIDIVVANSRIFFRSSVTNPRMSLDYQALKNEIRPLVEEICPQERDTSSIEEQQQQLLTLETKLRELNQAIESHYQTSLGNEKQEEILPQRMSQEVLPESTLGYKTPEEIFSTFKSNLSYLEVGTQAILEVVEQQSNEFLNNDSPYDQTRKNLKENIQILDQAISQQLNELESNTQREDKRKEKLPEIRSSLAALKNAIDAHYQISFLGEKREEESAPNQATTFSDEDIAKTFAQLDQAINWNDKTDLKNIQACFIYNEVSELLQPKTRIRKEAYRETVNSLNDAIETNPNAVIKNCCRTLLNALNAKYHTNMNQGPTFQDIPKGRDDRSLSLIEAPILLELYAQARYPYTERPEHLQDLLNHINGIGNPNIDLINQTLAQLTHSPEHANRYAAFLRELNQFRPTIINQQNEEIKALSSYMEDEKAIHRLIHAVINIEKLHSGINTNEERDQFLLCLKSILSRINTLKQTEEKQARFSEIAKERPYLLKVRGDGNCFWRSVYISTLLTANEQGLQSFEQIIRNTQAFQKYQNSVDREKVEKEMGFSFTRKRQGALLQHLEKMTEAGIDQMLVLALKELTAKKLEDLKGNHEEELNLFYQLLQVDQELEQQLPEDHKEIIDFYNDHIILKWEENYAAVTGAIALAQVLNCQIYQRFFDQDFMPLIYNSSNENPLFTASIVHGEGHFNALLPKTQMQEGESSTARQQADISLSSSLKSEGSTSGINTSTTSPKKQASSATNLPNHHFDDKGMISIDTLFLNFDSLNREYSANIRLETYKRYNQMILEGKYDQEKPLQLIDLSNEDAIHRENFGKTIGEGEKGFKVNREMLDTAMAYVINNHLNENQESCTIS